MIFTTHTHKKNLVYWGKLHLGFLTKFNYWLKGSLSLSLLGGVAAFFLSRQQKRKFRKAVGGNKKVYLFAPFWVFKIDCSSRLSEIGFWKEGVIKYLYTTTQYQQLTYLVNLYTVSPKISFTWEPCHWQQQAQSKKVHSILLGTGTKSA